MGTLRSMYESTSTVHSPQIPKSTLNIFPAAAAELVVTALERDSTKLLLQLYIEAERDSLVCVCVAIFKSVQH